MRDDAGAAGKEKELTYDKTSVLDRQGQTEQPRSDVPFEDVDESLENAEGDTHTHTSQGQTLPRIRSVSSARIAALTWFLLVLLCVRNGAEIWKVQERRGRERPFQRGSGPTAKELMSAKKKARVNPQTAELNVL